MSLWLVRVLVYSGYVCVHAYMPVFVECRQTDERKTERHISFIGSLGVLLFCFGGLTVLVHSVSP